MSSHQAAFYMAFAGIVFALLFYGAAPYTSAVVGVAAVFYIWRLSREQTPLSVRKIKYNKDAQTFEVFIENSGRKPLYASYAIHSLEERKEPDDCAVLESGLELLPATLKPSDESLLLLAGDSSASVLDCGCVSLLEAESACGEWRPPLNGLVEIAVSYSAGEGNPEKKAVFKVPAKVASTHPHLRTVGVERDFIFTLRDGIVGRARCLRDLSDLMRENPDASMTHFERGDIEKWVHDVVCDTRLSEELSRMRTTSEPHTLDEVADAVDRRIVELSYGGFQGKHPLLYDVEPWHAFQLKSDHENHIEACASLPTLHKAVESAPIKAIAFHLARGNDFAAWAKNTLGDAELAGRLSAIQAKDAEDAKLKVSAILHERITELGG